MTDPEEALERARASAASMRASERYGDHTEALRLQPEPVTTDKLLAWALIDPDLSVVGSTHRLRAPITHIKRLLLRLLAQYHSELLASQARFNVGVVGELRRLEERIDGLERKLDEHGPS
jgi:hypothetical protein